jgi:2-iminoacetate synthase ThiH
VTALVQRAVEEAGLSGVLAERRRAGTTHPEHLALLRAADLLALGALADLIRAEEVGAEVRMYIPPPPAVEGVFAFPTDGREWTGLELLREIAIARVTGPRAARVRVDWTGCGLEIAQIALGFGANELAGYLSTKIGALIGESDLTGVGRKSRLELASVAKKRELAAFVRRASRAPVFVRADGSRETIEEAPSTQEAT